jgi:hypothetical protein
MEFSPDMMMDIALNAVGYLAAGALSVVIYVLFTGRGRRADASAYAPSGSTAAESARAGGVDDGGRSVEFVRLSQQRTEAARPAYMEQRRNRVEVIGRARRMLDDGVPTEQIKKSLPISDAELALLIYEND